MARAEEYDLGYLRKHPPASLQNARVRHGIGFKPTIRSMESPVKALGTFGPMKPVGDPSVAEAEASWAAARKELAAYFEQVTDANAPFIKFHFLFGLLSAVDFLKLLEAHMTYHEARSAGTH